MSTFLSFVDKFLSITFSMSIKTSFIDKIPLKIDYFRKCEKKPIFIDKSPVERTYRWHTKLCVDT